MQTSAAADEGIVTPTEISPEASERIMQELANRQQWPSYQEMLVSCGAPVEATVGSSLRPALVFSQRHRATLPIAAYRSYIMSTIEASQCVVLCGETGWCVVHLCILLDSR